MFVVDDCGVELADAELAEGFLPIGNVMDGSTVPGPPHRTFDQTGELRRGDA
jgi:hypothetical protein